jgi:peptide/nickel transport system substrate-binding protein
MKRITYLVLSLLVVFGLVLTACGPKATEPVEETTETEVVEETEEPTEEPTEVDIPLVVTYTEFSNKFSSFFSESGYDFDVVAFVNINLLTTDRVGGIVNNAIEGETREYNGTPYEYKGAADTSVVYDEETDTTKYTATLRPDMVFSDGVPVTADDIIFTYYTLLDPSYTGVSSLSSYDIVGLKDYQTQTTSEVYDKYNALFEDIYAAGPDWEWSDADAWTADQQEDVWPRLLADTLAEAQGIIDYVGSNYMIDDYTSAYGGGRTADEVSASEGLTNAFAMCIWGFANCADDGSMTTYATETTWDLVEAFPTADDYAAEILAAYEYDIAAAFPYESAAGTDVLAKAKTDFVGYWGPLDESMGDEGVPNIAGIVKVDDLTVEVTVNGFSAPAVYSILGQDVTPMHYYGDVDMYDYENNMFGFPFGDLSKQESLTPTPLGAGPYVFVKYENKVVYFEANELYWGGAPLIKEIQFKETESAEVPSAVMTGTADVGEMTYSAERYAEVQSYNSNGEMTGDVITSSMVDNPGYGYIGINAATVKVGEDPGSEESKNLRKAFATIIAVHRDLSIDSYYGEGASVINYPISNTSWAAPQPTDPDYQIAFSVDVNGDPIYTADMTLEEKVAAAEAAALGFFEAAGFTVEDGMLTAAPEGAKLSYMGYVPGDGTGDHPNFAIFTSTQESLAKLGMEFVINDPADWNVMLDAIDAYEQEIWTMAWGSTIDPDMYQIYHSANIPELEGTDSNYYHIQDEELDQLIMDARLSDDQSYRKAVYKQCLDIVMDWAVEIPSYQRLNVIIFSTERVDLATLTPDITTFWDWFSDIEVLEMVQ